METTNIVKEMQSHIDSLQRLTQQNQLNSKINLLIEMKNELRKVFNIHKELSKNYINY